LPFAKSQQWVGYGMNHFDLLSDPAVYERIKRWLGRGADTLPAQSPTSH